MSPSHLFKHSVIVKKAWITPAQKGLAARRFMSSREGYMANTVKNVIGKEARRREINELLVGTFNSILRVEEGVLRNRLTEGLTIAEIHTIHAIGLQGASPMNVVASRLNVTLATCTTAIGKLVDKGFVKRTRSDADRRQVLVSLTKEGRQAYRVHELFHRDMVESALGELNEEEEEVFSVALLKIKAFFDAHDPA